MFNKIYDNIKKFIKENLLSIGILILVYAVCNIEFPYYINAPGNVINLHDRVSITSSYSTNDNMYMASVSEIKGIIPTLLWALIDKNQDIVKKEEIVYNNETYEETNLRMRIMLNDSMNSAKIVAFRAANKKYEIVNSKVYVTLIDEHADTNLKIGDELISIENKSISDITDVKTLVDNYNNNDIVNILVKRDNKEITCTAKIFPLENKKYIGISALKEYEVNTEPEVKFSFKSSESGPSGGLMLSLAIYNSLVEEDITGGKKIVGTGTIDADGNVGAIGGVKYKIAAAVKAKADLFLVPSDNYEEAKEVVEKHNYKIKLISVSTFDEAIDKLSKN